VAVARVSATLEDLRCKEAGASHQQVGAVVVVVGAGGSTPMAMLDLLEYRWLASRRENSERPDPPLCSNHRGSGHGQCWHVFSFVETKFLDFWKQKKKLEGPRTSTLLAALENEY
jgi:hypothetical protein